MFATAARVARPIAASASPLSNGFQTRNMATLKEIQLRLKSIQNISKITKSMKMIASTKVARAQRTMEHARVYGKCNNEVFKGADTKPLEDSATLYITASSDRGLCGGIHTSISKHTRRLIDDKSNAQIIVLGDKAKMQLQRSHRNAIQLSFNQIGKDIPTFAEACSIVDTIQKADIPYDHVQIVYNEFKSVVAYEATAIDVYSEDTFKSSPNFAVYEIEDDVLENLQEFAFANNVYWALVEGHAAEMASKRNAMENATKNAGEMIDKLTITYNRGRQAAITNELVDIITGASAL